jgi:flagellar M-ring protein FliF
VANLPFIAGLSARARIAFMACAAGVILLAIAAAWWVSHPPYGVLFRDIKQADAAEITTALDQLQVSYRLADDGATILVPEDRVYDARMKLVSQGVPKGSSAGFELFKDSDYGVTEFAQKVNFQRALQGELERTIESLDEVTSARVHLTLRRGSLFEDDKTPAKASVTLTLKPRRHVDAAQVAGVQRLVASAVEGLEPSSVVVLDDRGTPLVATAGAPGQAAASDALDQQARAEQDLRARATQLLGEALPGQAFSVSVDVALNYDRVKRVSEHLITQGKDGNGLLLRQKTNSTGRLTNDTEADGSHPATASLGQESEYAHGREQEEYESAPGRIQRITVGIVVPQVLPPAQVTRLEDVVAAGLGLDIARGDRVRIAGFPVVSAVAQPVSAAPQPDASTPAAHPSPVVATTSTAHWAAFPVSSIAVACVLCCFVGVVWMLRRGRREAAARLTREERDQLLRQMLAWAEEGAPR